MLRQANIWAVSNPENVTMLQMRMSSPVLICISDSVDDSIVRSSGVIDGRLLLPPYESIQRELDNDPIAADIYINHLRSYECTQMMEAIALAVSKSNNIILYFGPEFNEFRFGRIFLECMAVYYGVNCGIDGQGQPSFEDTAIPFILEDMVKSGSLNGKDAFITMPPNSEIPDILLNGFIGAFNPPKCMVTSRLGEEPTIEDYRQYFRQLLSDYYKYGFILREVFA